MLSGRWPHNWRLPRDETERIHSSCAHYFFERFFVVRRTTDRRKTLFTIFWRRFFGVGDKPSLFYGHAFFWIPICVCSYRFGKKETGGDTWRRYFSGRFCSAFFTHIMAFHLSTAPIYDLERRAAGAYSLTRASRVHRNTVFFTFDDGTALAVLV